VEVGIISTLLHLYCQYNTGNSRLSIDGVTADHTITIVELHRYRPQTISATTHNHIGHIEDDIGHS